MTRQSAAIAATPGIRPSGAGTRRAGTRHCPARGFRYDRHRPRGGGFRLAKDGRAPHSSDLPGASLPGWSSPMSLVPGLTRPVSSTGGTPAVIARRRRLIGPVSRGQGVDRGLTTTVAWILGVAVLGTA